MIPHAAFAENASNALAEEAGVPDSIIVTGTRSSQRTAADSSVPVDVLNADDLVGSTPSPDLNDKLAKLVPSFNVQRLPQFDGAAFVRPATLRGLSADQTLVLIDGKRRHRSAYISIPQQGEQAVDLSQIPQIALGRIEVLRDGASAQYGSDAIAGVINLILDDTPGFAVEGQAGQYYAGDGELYQVAGRAGFDLGGRGVFNLSGEYSSQGETDRGTGVQKIGQPLVKGWKVFANLRYDLTDAVELYGFGNVNRVRSRSDFYARAPGSDVYRRSFFQDNAPFAYPAWNLANIYPDGFVPVFSAVSRDYSALAGLRGDLSDDLSWDVSGRYGRSEIDFGLAHSINASLGPDSPTSFDAGNQSQTEFAANADFNWRIDTGLAQPINLAFGVEWRRERFHLGVGDEAAYIAGPLEDLTPGSNGYPSPTPDQAGRWSRDSRAAYVDIEADFTDRLNMGGALRFEDFDGFGSTWNYKVSARYKATPWLNLRAAVNSGFHAPTPGQQNLTNTTQGPDPASPPPAPQVIQTNGLIPSTNPIAVAAGGKPLVPEKSTSFSAGLVVTPAVGLTLSVDYYNIKIDDRLGLTSTLTLTPAQRDALVAAGVSQAAQLSTFRFFINGYDTRTQGVDVVASYATEAGPGRLALTAAYNYNRTKLTGGDPKIVTANLVQEVSDRRPRHTGNIGASYLIGRFELGTRLRYYSGFTDTVPSIPAELNESYGGEAFVDLSASYQATDAVKLTIGAENLFDNYPDENKGLLTFLGVRYPMYRPYEADGGRYYARVSAKF